MQASHASTWTATHTDLSTVKAVVAAHGGATKVHVDDAGGVAFHLTLPVHTHGELSSSAKARSRTLKHGVRGWYAESGTYVAGATEVPQVPGTEGTGSDASGETTFGWSPSGLDRTSVSILGSELVGVPGTATLQPGYAAASPHDLHAFACPCGAHKRGALCRTSVFSTVTDECPSVVCAASDEAVLRAMEEASATCGTTAELLQSAADLQALLARWPHARCVLVLLWGLAGAFPPPRFCRLPECLMPYNIQHAGAAVCRLALRKSGAAGSDQGEPSRCAHAAAYAATGRRHHVCAAARHR